jgi:ABC-type uncharacterized transport system ATPase subunit
VSQVNPCGARPSLIDALCKGTFGRSDLLQDPSQASTYASSSDAVGIEASGLSKRYSEKLAVDDLSFQVQPGIVTGFLGPNGAGKSTTMRLILGLGRATAGNVTVNGCAYADFRARRASGSSPSRTAISFRTTDFDSWWSAGKWRELLVIV